MFDVVVIGGGPAGLQAALTLARGQRRVVVLDSGPPRNERAVHLHNFVTRDGVPPLMFRQTAHAELRAYDVEVRDARAVDVVGEIGDFRVHTADGDPLLTRRVVLAVGMIDLLPDLPGIEALWGDTVFRCPYCHGHEVRGLRWAVFANVPQMLEMAVICRAWTDDVVAISASPVDPELRTRLATAGVRVDERAISALTPTAGRLGGLVMADGEVLARDVLMVAPPQRQTPLVLGLGLDCDDAGYVIVASGGQTSRPGIYAAGDLTTPMQSAIFAAAAGAMAAAMLNHALTKDLLGFSASP